MSGRGSAPGKSRWTCFHHFDQAESGFDVIESRSAACGKRNNEDFSDGYSREFGKNIVRWRTADRKANDDNFHFGYPERKIFPGTANAHNYSEGKYRGSTMKKQIF